MKSQKGKKGTVGAPLKTIQFPKGKFTRQSVIGLNRGRICNLTVIKRFDKLVEDGILTQVGKQPQAKKSAGRPRFLFQHTAEIDAAKKFVHQVNPATTVEAVVA